MITPLVLAYDLIKKDQRLYSVPASSIACIHEHFENSVKLVQFDATAHPNAKLEASIDVYWGNFFSVDLLDRMPQLKWIHCASVGVNRAVAPEVAARKIFVTNSHGVLAPQVSAAVIGMICALARGFHHAWRLRTEGRMNRFEFDYYFDEMHDLEGQRCLIVGLGDVGSRVAAVCVALGMKVTAIKKRPSQVPISIDRVYTLDELTAAVSDADYVVNLLPLTAKTTDVFNDDIFDAMKPSAFFINAGRGQTVNEAALIRALAHKRIAGAGLDVFAVEPLPASSPLWGMQSVILMPHVACLSTHYWRKQTQLLKDNINSFRNGAPLKNLIDLSVGY